LLVAKANDWVDAPLVTAASVWAIFVQFATPLAFQSSHAISINAAATGAFVLEAAGVSKTL